MTPCPKPERPCEGWSVDLITDMPPSQGGHRYILVAVDCFSKWVELIPLFTKESEEVASALYHHLFARFGKPKWIRCDAGKEFEGLVTSLSRSLGVVVR